MAKPLVSIIIPTFNEAKRIGSTIDRCMRLPGRWEIIVVDGDSDDETRDLVPQSSVALVAAPRGRGTQLQRGAQSASGEILLFLHADTALPDCAYGEVVAALSTGSTLGGNFALQFEDAVPKSSFLEWLYPNLGLVGLAYGDSAIFVSRAAFEAVGGFRPYPIFEDLDLIRRLRQRGSMVRLQVPVVTSSRRFKNKSFPLTLARWTALQVLFWLGVSPHVLGKYYSHIRD